MKSLTARQLKEAYLDFFEKKGHAVIKSASLVPSKDDPTVLCPTAGMHPLVSYLVGSPHPKGRRLVDFQKCIRTGDIDEVGDNSHLTFFEMLGNWSLGDYFKKESIEWSYEFLTKVLMIDAKKIYVTLFEGDSDAPKDVESEKIWLSLGLPKERIFFLPKEDNWWGPAGEAGPCGPDTEIFFDTGKPACSKKCQPGCSCGKYLEIWNNVFMGYNKTSEGKFVPLKQKNVDTGMGVERTVAILQGKGSVYEIEVFKPLLSKLSKISRLSNEKATKIVADHMRAAVFILGDDVKTMPSNVGRGYVLRRLIRRSVRYARFLGIDHDFTRDLAKEVIITYKEDYPSLAANEKYIFDELSMEYQRFSETLAKGLSVFDKIAKNKIISGVDAFLLFQSYGFPIEMTQELAVEKGISVDVDGFNKEYGKHQEVSRNGAEQKFKGGLVDASEQSAKLHTATHLLGQALRDVLGKEVMQRGSNITADRLRYDFSFGRKMEPAEIQKVEGIVNHKIKEALPVVKKEMPLAEAKKLGAIGVFEHKYGEVVSVYLIGSYSKELCGGPHVSNTSELGHFKIQKEEASSAGVRRIKAVLE